MKKVKWIVSFLVFLLPIRSLPVSAQSFEVEQLLLNVEKLAQLKQILQDMYKGYEVLHNGYTTIKDISEGNFSLHKVFLDGLFEVSPTVQKYKRVADIINYQLQIVKEYKAAYNRFKQDNNFTVQEIEYMGKVYNNLFKESLKKLDELITVITAGQLRMSDDERIAAIDRIFSEVEDQVNFLRYFNSKAAVLSAQRGKEFQEVEISKKLFDVK
jgi:DNA repair ATPase RecN